MSPDERGRVYLGTRYAGEDVEVAVIGVAGDRCNEKEERDE